MSRGALLRVFFQTEHQGLRKHPKTISPLQIITSCFLQTVFGHFLSPTRSDSNNKNTLIQAPRKTTLEYPHAILSMHFLGGYFF